MMSADLIRLQCYEGVDASQALYDWNFARQMLHVRSSDPSDGRSDNIYGSEFLVERPVLRALRQSPSVLLIDEIDRADEEFEALLLEVLEDYSITIPEYGTVTAVVPPLVVLTSNRTREVHDALKRRCLYHWIPYPDQDREEAIVRRAVPAVSDRLARDVVIMIRAVRTANVAKIPGIAESIDAARSAHELEIDTLDGASARSLLSTVVKQADDQKRIETDLLPRIVRALDTATG
ncbi:MAG: hypothetical protein QOE61_4813 [Micromonosporaceae bacterium]|nr:hypothetical protein [Micromonosporaceae bacterium]